LRTHKFGAKIVSFDIKVKVPGAEVIGYVSLIDVLKIVPLAVSRLRIKIFFYNNVGKKLRRSYVQRKD